MYLGAGVEFLPLCLESLGFVYNGIYSTSPGFE